MGTPGQAGAREARRDQGAVLIIGRDTYDEVFTRRFEADGADFLFRASPTDPPVRVTAVEMERERTAFRRGIRYLGWGLIAAVTVLCTVLVLLDLDLGDDAYRSRLTQGLGGGFVLLFLGGWWWLWRAPNRRFERRPPAGAARTEEEVRAEALRTLGWMQIGMSAGLGVLLASRALDGEWFLPAIGGVGLIVAIVGAVRKLRGRAA